MHGQLSSFLLESKALPDEQFGFLRGHSAELQLLSVVKRWHKALDQRHLVHAVFLDAAKAFDRVNHRLLLQSFTHWEFEECRFNGFKATCQIGLSEFA